MSKNLSPIIVAIDVPTIEEMRILLKRLDPKLCRIKIGHILFTRYGPLVVEEAISYGYAVFLDLKFHDIPETVIGACRAVAHLGVWMVNFHIQGGQAMLEGVVRTFSEVKAATRPLLIGVTVLTSLDQTDLELLGFRDSLPSLVTRMAELAKSIGFDGVVCSAQEAQLIRQRCGDRFVLVSPGIRVESDTQDQKRIMTPQSALRAGANYLVIGRPITKAEDPLLALHSILSGI